MLGSVLILRDGYTTSVADGHFDVKYQDLRRVLELELMEERGQI
jgi:hypothetical protein